MADESLVPTDSDLPTTANAPELLRLFTGGANRPDYYTSLPLKTEEDKARVLAARMNEIEPASEKIGTLLRLQHILMHPASKIDPVSGEALELLRIVLIDSGGQMLEAFSIGIARDVRILCDTFGYPPWPNGLPVTIKRTKTGRGFWMMGLEWTPSSNGKKGGKP